MELQHVHHFMDFVRKSPTAYQAVAEAEKLLRDQGFQKLGLYADWKLTEGGRYYCTRNGSSLIAFVMPKTASFDHFQLVCSHSDSPAFVLKENPEENAVHCVRLNTEGYGGMILSSWLDKPLGIAGRIYARRTDGVLECRLVDFGRDMCIIPNMCIHLMRDTNSGYAYNPQTDMMPLWGMDGIRSVRKAVRREFCQADETIVSMELYLYNRTPGMIFGEEAFFSCPRIDNLECAYTSLLSVMQNAPDGQVNVCGIFDNEEVGSATKQGANSDLLRSVLESICELSGMNPLQTRSAIASSLMISADNAHAVHPNHPEKFDADNRVFLNEGVVIKRSANQKYTTDAISNAMFREVCERAQVPVQCFHNRSDIPGGSTLGNLANIHAGMSTVDIGLAQLSMHSCYETAGTQDLEHMIKALTAFYAARIEIGEKTLRFS